MNNILEREDLTPTIHLFKINAPEIAEKAQAGQFVIVKIDEKGERIPLTLADWNSKAGTITVVFMEVGTSTFRLNLLKAGDNLTNLVGPLGMPSCIENFGTVVCVAGGVGTAPIYPIARSLKAKGNRVIIIQGARCKELIFWEEKLRSVSNELIITTDDGSYGRKGLVVEPLKEILQDDENINRVIAIGPSIMMKFTSKTTEPFKIPTIVSLNTIMVDGIGMCGCCRVSVNKVSKFACVEGPEFDGHLVDWDGVIARQQVYLKEEKYSYDRYKQIEKSVA